jgi:hypothetical protein
MDSGCGPSGRHLAPSWPISAISFQEQRNPGGRPDATLFLSGRWAFQRPSGCLSCRIFVSFPTTPISSQSDTRAESYDKNTEMSAEIFLEAWNENGRCCPSVRTVNCNRLSKIAQFYPYQVHVQTAWPSVRTIFAVSPFLARKGFLEYFGMLDIVRMHCRNFPNSVDFWEQNPCWILIDRASEWCCSDVRMSSMFICKTLRGVQTEGSRRSGGCC